MGHAHAAVEPRPAAETTDGETVTWYEHARAYADRKGWKVVDEHHITRAFTFPDFKTALEFVNLVGAIAEEQGHHPDIAIHWNKVDLVLWTHKIGGLHENDFILAAKINRLLEESSRAAANVAG